MGDDKRVLFVTKPDTMASYAWITHEKWLSDGSPDDEGGVVAMFTDERRKHEVVCTVAFDARDAVIPLEGIQEAIELEATHFWLVGFDHERDPKAAIEKGGSARHYLDHSLTHCVGDAHLSSHGSLKAMDVVVVWEQDGGLRWRSLVCSEPCCPPEGSVFLIDPVLQAEAALSTRGGDADAAG